jgi:hypothetical protein
LRDFSALTICRVFPDPVTIVIGVYLKCNIRNIFSKKEEVQDGERQEEQGGKGHLKVSSSTRVKQMRSIVNGRNVGGRKHNLTRNKEKSESTRCDYSRCWHRGQSPTPTLHSSITSIMNTKLLYFNMLL